MQDLPLKSTFETSGKIFGSMCAAMDCETFRRVALNRLTFCNPLLHLIELSRGAKSDERKDLIEALGLGLNLNRKIFCPDLMRPLHAR